MTKRLEQNGVEVWMNDRGYIECARLVDDDTCYHSGHPEFQALIAQFNGQPYAGTAW